MSRKATIRPSIMDAPRMVQFETCWDNVCDCVMVIQHFVIGTNRDVLNAMNSFGGEYHEKTQGVRKAIRGLRKDGYGTAPDSKARRVILARHQRRAIDAMGTATHALWQADEVIDPPEIPRHLRTVVLLDEHILELAAMVGQLVRAHGKNETTRLIRAVRVQDKVREVDRILDRLRSSPQPTALSPTDGWSPKSLYRMADISPASFSKLCRQCQGLKRPGNGRHDFRFGRKSVEQLVAGARALDTKMFRSAAATWSEMLKDSET